jgi:hypothetical protein
MGSDSNSGGGAGGGLYAIVGALVVIVGLGAYFMFGGDGPNVDRDGPDVKIEGTLKTD